MYLVFVVLSNWEHCFFKVLLFTTMHASPCYNIQYVYNYPPPLPLVWSLEALEAKKYRDCPPPKFK